MAPAPLRSGTFTESWLNFSPDGHYVVYAGTDTGRYQIYVRTFEQNPGGQPIGKWTISGNGAAREPQWTQDGRMLVWYQDKAAWGATVNFSGGFHAGVPQKLYDIPDALGAASLNTRKAQALVINSLSAAADEPINVIVNWAAGLKN